MFVRYSCLHSHFQPLQPSLRSTFTAVGTLPYQLACASSMASVLHLAPLSFPRKVTRPVSYYALFKGWLLLSQPPGCFSGSTSFSTKPVLRDLSWRSGLFPF